MNETRERIGHLEQKVRGAKRPKQEVMNEEEGENSNGHSNSSDHDNDKSQSRSEGSKMKQLNNELSWDMRKVTPPQFEGTTSGDAVEAWLIEMEKYF